MKVICDYCNKEARFVGGKIVYPHRSDLFKKRFWFCEPCAAWVGCHERNVKEGYIGHEPLGRLANSELRLARINAHGHFDKLWKAKIFTRGKAYEKLAKYLKIPVEECHIGMFDIDKCLAVLKFNPVGSGDLQ